MSFSFFYSGLLVLPHGVARLSLCFTVNPALILEYVNHVTESFVLTIAQFSQIVYIRTVIAFTLNIVSVRFLNILKRSML